MEIERRFTHLAKTDEGEAYACRICDLIVRISTTDFIHGRYPEKIHMIEDCRKRINDAH